MSIPPDAVILLKFLLILACIGVLNTAFILANSPRRRR